MRIVRIHNDINFIWRFYKKSGDDSVPYDIDRFQLKAVITNQFGTKITEQVSASGNEATFVFLGKQQKATGVYNVTMYFNPGTEGMKAVGMVAPFKLVKNVCGNAADCCSGDTEEGPITIEFASEIAPIHPHGGGGSVDDVQIDGESIVDDEGVANIETREVGQIEVGDIISHDADEFAKSEELSEEIQRATARENELERRIEGMQAHPYISLERLREYLYKVTFDRLPEDNGSEGGVFGACSSYVKDGKLYRNLDWNYDNAASFIVRTRNFIGMSFISGLNDSEIDDTLVAQLPYRMVDGRNNHGIMVSTHVLYNDWEWKGCGNKSIDLTRLPFMVLSKVKSMATIDSDLNGVINNIKVSEAMYASKYLIQVLVTDGETTFALMPPKRPEQSYIIQDITDNPKLSNFRWVERENVSRTDEDIQNRPTGIERWNLMPCSLGNLRFTKAYEEPNRLSEFIGIDGTTKDSTDAELLQVYNTARGKYLQRTRNGETWQTMHSVVYGKNMEELYIQENWNENVLAPVVKPMSGIVEHGTTEYWNSKTGYVPAEGVIIVYDDYKSVTKEGVETDVPGIKIGTGNAYVQDLSFVGEYDARRIQEHIENTAIHVSAEDRQRWNNKLGVNDSSEVVEETLVFIR